VTGGSDGSVRVWSLEKMAPIHRLAAHDNSVTSLQFDDVRVVSGGSDGRVKIWDLKTGQQVRELTAPADAVWRVAFEEEKCVVMASRSNRTIMEVGQLPTQFTCRLLTPFAGMVILTTRRHASRIAVSILHNTLTLRPPSQTESRSATSTTFRNRVSSKSRPRSRSSPAPFRANLKSHLSI
jgi:WD40 repeat protein